MLLRIQKDESLRSYVERSRFLPGTNLEIITSKMLSHCHLDGSSVKKIASLLGWQGCYGFNRLLHEHTESPSRYVFKSKFDYSYSGFDYLSSHSIDSLISHRPYCPVCAREDKIKLGYSYWRRIHRDVRVCPKHNVTLLTGITRRTAEIEANRWPTLLDELERWEHTAGSSQDQAAIEASRQESVEIEKEKDRVRMELLLLHQSRSEREKALAQITDGLTRQLLPDGAVGVFDPRDEVRPFRLSMRGGEAYRVLEVLLGDVACMLDSARTESSLPGLFIHDCPREADMSTGLYENFLSLVARVQGVQYQDTALPFQYIVTTTTPPPANLQSSAICVILDPSSDEGLLFGKRFTADRQVEQY